MYSGASVTGSVMQVRVAVALSVVLMSACATAPPVIDNELISPPLLEDCTPSYAEELTKDAGSLTPIQAEVWLRNIIRDPAYSPLGNELISKLSEGRDSDWATLTIGRDLTRTGSSYRFFLHDGIILRKELSVTEDGLSEEDAQKAELEITECEIGPESVGS